MITLRNLIVNICAAFIRDKRKRRVFRGKYKAKSINEKFNELYAIVQSVRDLEMERSLTFRVVPLNDSPPSGPASQVFLAIACIAKNEAPYLREWIEYHRIVGVERFYFYDNESDDDTKEVLEPYVKDGIVVYHHLPNHPITGQRQQTEAYEDAIFKYRDRTRWLALIDVDEFIVPVEKDSIPDFLADYEQYPAVVANWVCFDSNGHDRKPTANGGLVTANFTRARKEHNLDTKLTEGDDRHVKSIVNPKQVVKCLTPHHALYYRNYDAVTENFEGTRGDITKRHSIAKIRINHYQTKSREEYANKVSRNHKGSQNVYRFNEDMINFQDATADDLIIQKYIPRLKAVIGITD